MVRQAVFAERCGAGEGSVPLRAFGQEEGQDRKMLIACLVNSSL